jgi:hypothetical protein
MLRAKEESRWLGPNLQRELRGANPARLKLLRPANRVETIILSRTGWDRRFRSITARRLRGVSPLTPSPFSRRAIALAPASPGLLHSRRAQQRAQPRRSTVSCCMPPLTLLGSTAGSWRPANQFCANNAVSRLMSSAVAYHN